MNSVGPSELPSYEKATAPPLQNTSNINPVSPQIVYVYQNQSSPVGQLLFIIGFFMWPSWCIGGFCLPTNTPDEERWKQINRKACFVCSCLVFFILVVYIVILTTIVFPQ